LLSDVFVSMHADVVQTDHPHRMNPRPEAVWVDDPAADDGGFWDEWQACAEDEARFREKVDVAEAEINTLPVMRQERWRRMPLGLLTGRNRGRLQFEARRFQSRPLVRPRCSRARGSTRARRTRRTARTCGPRGDPDPAGEAEDEDLARRRLPAEVAS
jgi:hypothetical protein